jgi:hypothetical protein
MTTSKRKTTSQDAPSLINYTKKQKTIEGSRKALEDRTNLPYSSKSFHPHFVTQTRVKYLVIFEN